MTSFVEFTIPILNRKLSIGNIVPIKIIIILIHFSHWYEHSLDKPKGMHGRGTI